MTIEDLARRAGVSTRNVRAYRTAGLLPPPRLDGRTGRYGDEHVERLAVIARLQGRGWALAAIRDALAARDGGRALEDRPGAAPAGTGWGDEPFDAHQRGAGPDALPPQAGWN